MKGSVFWRKDTAGEKYHLRFIISDPDIDSNVLVVSLFTYRDKRWQETTCILDNTDHPNITTKSYIDFKSSIEINTTDILREKFKGSIILKESINNDVLRKIQKAAKKSSALPNKLKKYFAYF